MYFNLILPLFLATITRDPWFLVKIHHPDCVQVLLKDDDQASSKHHMILVLLFNDSLWYLSYPAHGKLGAKSTERGVGNLNLFLKILQKSKYSFIVLSCIDFFFLQKAYCPLEMFHYTLFVHPWYPNPSNFASNFAALRIPTIYLSW